MKRAVWRGIKKHPQIEVLHLREGCMTCTFHGWKIEKLFFNMGNGVFSPGSSQTINKKWWCSSCFSPLSGDEVDVVADRSVVLGPVLRRGVAAWTLRFGWVGVGQTAPTQQQAEDECHAHQPRSQRVGHLVWSERKCDIKQGVLSKNVQLKTFSKLNCNSVFLFLLTKQNFFVVYTVKTLFFKNKIKILIVNLNLKCKGGSVTYPSEFSQQWCCLSGGGGGASDLLRSSRSSGFYGHLMRAP